METKVNYALVGGFVLVLSSALIAVILWLSSGGGWQKKYDLYLALVDESVAGLNLNAAVKYRGVDVGKVRDIQLDAQNPQQVRLTFAILRGTPIKEDTEAVLKIQGLTGIAYVELDGGSADSPPLRASTPGEYPVIRTKPSLAARLENLLSTVLSKLDSTTDNINKILSDQNRVAITNTLADMAVFARTLAARQRTLDAAITSAARTFDNSARVSAQMGPVLESVDNGAIAVSSAAKKVELMGTDVRRLTDTAPDLQHLVGELNILSASLRRVVEETERNPRSFLFGRNPIPAGPGENTEGTNK